MLTHRVPPPYKPPPACALEEIYSDKSIVIIDKPSGLLSVPGIGPEKAFCAASIVADRFGDSFIVHRLDMDTSGVMVFARTKAAQRHLSRQFERRSVKKTYEAVVAGHLSQPSGRIDAAIAKFSKQRPLRHLDPAGQDAITDWTHVSRSKSCSRLALYPQTGRSHQLRLHLQSIGHPILGDAFYGDITAAKRLLLHARSLQINHPDTDEFLNFESKPKF